MQTYSRNYLNKHYFLSLLTNFKKYNCPLFLIKLFFWIQIQMLLLKIFVEKKGRLDLVNHVI